MVDIKILTLIFALFSSYTLHVTLGQEGPLQNRNGPKWDYNKPEQWGHLYPNCNGHKQSPINIDKEKTVIHNQDFYPKFHFVNYDKIIPTFLTYNGHTYVLNMSDSLNINELPSISGGGLLGRYIFTHLHFHWSSDLIERNGSEHTINDLHYPVEIHLVHYNSKYKNIYEAINEVDGYAILSVFMVESNRSSVPMDQFIYNAESAHKKKEMWVSMINPFPLIDLLPKNTGSFYRYLGSVTNPGCQESVTWTLFYDTLEISTTQIEKFATLVDDDGQSLSHYNRPIQALNNRRVTYNPGPLGAK